MVGPSPAQSGPYSVKAQKHVSPHPNHRDSSSNAQMAKVNSISPMKGITVNYTLNYGYFKLNLDVVPE